MKRCWLIDGWRWWRYNHQLSFFKAIRFTFSTEIWYPILNIYAWFWLIWNGFKIRHLWWTKHYKLTREVKELEKKLFKDAPEEP